MGIYLNPDNMDFQRAVNSKVYVDKTGLIAFTNSVLMTEQQYICVSRPRRFGKSMAANMLTAYYSCGCDSEKLFRGLKIAKSVDFKKHLNQYNVIRMEMQSFLTEADDMDDMIRMIQKSILFDLTEEFPDVRYFDDTKLVRSLKDVFTRYRVPFIFIIDEWDCIFREHKDDQEAQKKYLDFLRNLLKDQSYVALAYMTGILPIKKYGKHSALNMFYEYSVMNAKPIEEFTGFTETEVKALCEQYQVSYDRMKKMYDGYTVNGLSIYNPKSVVESIVRGAFDSYWTKTETYEALKPYIQMDFDGLRMKVEQLIAGESVSVNPLKYQNDMTTLESADDVLTLLVHLGYLTAANSEETALQNAEALPDSYLYVGNELYPVDCTIPNREVQQEFINCMEDGGWENVMDAIRNSDELLRCTFSGDEAAVAQRIAVVHMENASALQYNNEISLSCVISLAYYAAKNRYTIVREMSAGKGFADLVFVPDRNCSAPAMIVELKWNKSVETALDQIRRQEYTACLERYRGEILLVGVNYDKDNKEHSCKIERIRK
ncbi:MAG: ATP-binding protein [Lachnospiraceae bacterium]|nr:ATP-binding protein [Lachnospiraceae bacterium]